MLSETFAHNPRTLLHFAPYLKENSILPTEIFARSDISPSAILDENGWVPRELCFRLGHEIYAATGERFFGADIGRRFQLEDLGAWSQAVTYHLDTHCELITYPATRHVMLRQYGQRVARSVSAPQAAAARPTPPAAGRPETPGPVQRTRIDRGRAARTA